MKRHSLVVCIAFLFSLIGTAISMAADDPQIGAWKLNVSKSQFVIGTPPKSLINTVESIDGGYKFIDDAITNQGEKQHKEKIVKYDGKDYPVVESRGGYDTVAFTVVDAYTWRWFFKKDGKEVGTGSIVISRDGKTKPRPLVGVQCWFTTSSSPSC